jgi:hypothetical protein
MYAPCSSGSRKGETDSVCSNRISLQNVKCLRTARIWCVTITEMTLIIRSTFYLGRFSHRGSLSKEPPHDILKVLSNSCGNMWFACSRRLIRIPSEIHVFWMGLLWFPFSYSGTFCNRTLKYVMKFPDSSLRSSHNLVTNDIHQRFPAYCLLTDDILSYSQPKFFLSGITY